MDSIIFRYFIGMAVQIILEMHLMNVVITYLYGSFNAHIYMKVPLGLETINQTVSIPSKHCDIKLQRTLYGFKQSGLM